MDSITLTCTYSNTQPINHGIQQLQILMQMYYKSELFLQTFGSNKLKCKIDLTKKEFNLFIKKNEFLNTEYILGILLYCNYNKLRDELIMSYRNKKKRQNEFYNFGIIYTITNGYGFNGFINDRKIKFYHCFSNPVLFQNLRCEFNGGPVSIYNNVY